MNKESNYTRPKTNIDFNVNTRGQLVQYFTNPFNACQGKIIDGVKYDAPIFGNMFFDNYFKFTFLENSYR